MKVGIGVLVVIAVILGFSPYYIGGQIESLSKGSLENLRAPGYEFSVEVERGYRSSIHTFNIGLDPALFIDPTNPEFAESFVELAEGVSFDVHVQHGPVLTEKGFGFGFADFSIDLNEEQSPELQAYFDLFDVESFFTGGGRMDFSGSGEFELAIPRLNFVDEETGDNVRFNGFSGNGDFSEFGQAYTFEGHAPNLVVALDSLYMSVGEMNLASNVVMEEGSIYWGDVEGSFSIETVAIGSSEFSGTIEGTEFSFSMHDGDSDETVTIDYFMGVENYDSRQVDLENIQADFSYTNLSKLFVEDYMDIISSFNLADEEAAEEAVLLFVIDALPVALGYGPGFAFPKVAFTHEGRSFEAGVSVAIDGQQVPANFDIQRWDLLLPALAGELYLDSDESLLNEIMAWQAASSVDASLANVDSSEITPEMRQTMIDQQATMMIGIAESQGFLLRENGRIKSDIQLADRTLNINGASMPAPF